MEKSIRSKVIKIGNSRGIRIPSVILEQTGLTDEVEMSVSGNKLIIQPVQHLRQDWEKKFAEMSAQGDDLMLDDSIPTEWDEEEWEWRSNVSKFTWLFWILPWEVK